MKKMIKRTSPNFNNRPAETVVDMLVLHYTGMPSADEALERLCDPAAKVSAHYLIDEAGQLYQLVPEECRAWHAGVSFWRGNTNINDRSIGIELVNLGHEFGYQPFPQAQMETLLPLAKQILSRHPIPPRNIVGHSDIAPTRKQDPGELFNWAELADQGIGIWPDLARDENYPPLQKADFNRVLGEYGYDVSDAAAATRAFQRHFQPATCTGLVDAETAKILGLINAKL